MAFATSNVKKEYFGGLKVTFGDWSAASGDAAGTIGVEGGRVYLASFTSYDSTGALQEVPARVSVSTSGAVTTVTVYHLEDVTTGRFLIIHS